MLTCKNNRATPHDDLLPGLPIQLDGARVREILQQNWKEWGTEVENCEVEYVRYKPATNCLTTYRVRFLQSDSSAPREIVLFGKCLTAIDYLNAAEKLQAKRATGRHEFPQAILLPDALMIIDAMPHDPQLEGLETLFDARKLRRIMYEILPSHPDEKSRISHKKLRTEVIRYKPEKRAVVKVSTVVSNLKADEKHDLTLYIRCYCDDRGSAIHELSKQLEKSLNSRGSVQVPRAYAYISDKHLLIMEGLDGTPLGNLLCSEHVDEYVSRTAAALWQVHCLDFPCLEFRSTEIVYRDALATGDSMIRILPQKRNEVEQILTALESRRPASGGALGLVHGDFYYGQVLIQSQGEALLDFDRSYRGDRLFDLGNFCAHLQVLESQGGLSHANALGELFVKSYEAESGKSVDRGALAYWTGFGLFLLAIRPFRTLQADWPEKTAAILSLCRKALA